jgi:hypothetical protein
VPITATVVPTLSSVTSTKLGGSTSAPANAAQGTERDRHVAAVRGLDHEHLGERIVAGDETADPAAVAQPDSITRLRLCSAALGTNNVGATYSITSSASSCMALGTESPSAFAVLRLITNSNLVERCTGRSAGFSPFTIRPT